MNGKAVFVKLKGLCPFESPKGNKNLFGGLRGSAPQSKVKPRLVGRELHLMVPMC